MIKRRRFNESLEDRVTRLESALRRSTRNRRRFEADGEDRYEVVGLDYTRADRDHYENLCYKATLKGSAMFEEEQGKDYPESYCTLRLREVESDNGREVLVPAYRMDDGREEEIIDNILFGTEGCFKWQGGRLVKISDSEAIDILAQGVYDIDSENTDWYGYEDADDEEYESVRRSARNLRTDSNSRKR